ncbi:MAG: aminoacyl-tRNA hydrolase [Patescibacteria group bacterium]
MPDKLPTQPLLIVGLGNPGSKYRLTRHNLGYLVVEKLADLHQASWQEQTKLQAFLASFKINNQTIRLLKPLTYMNQSGLSVKKAADYFKIKKDNIWLVHDDLDLPLGTIRLSYRARSGGHNGVQSVFDELGATLNWRWRLGINRPPQNLPIEDFVLQKFSPAEKKLSLKSVQLAAELIEKNLTSQKLTGQTIKVN